jgi:acyl-CoA reductase-like NAD-dependent aldehyde dehydrogenase
MREMNGPPPSDPWGSAEAEPDVIRVLRPTDGSLVGELAVTPVQEVPKRVARARSVQEGWGSLEPRDRERRLRGLLKAIGSRSREIEDTIVAETGKPRVEAILEIITVTDLIRYYLKHATAFFKPRRVSPSWLVWKKAQILREPLGVIGVISPWNYPFILSMNPVVTALFGGNGVVLKPSEFTPYSGLLAEDLARDAGLPDGLVQVIIGGGGTGDALVRSGIDKVHFTGGSRTGRVVLAAAAETLTPAVLELGGKDPAIVLEDADLERAARGIVWGSFVNAGQTCIAVERVYVVEEIYDAFLREVLIQVRGLKSGSTPDVDTGPMTTPGQLRVVEEQLAEAVARGATVVLGGGRTDPASNVVSPTVLTELDPGCRMLQEETFGPVLPIVRVKDAEDAVRGAREGPFGLSASVWTRDRGLGLSVAQRLRAGAVCINDVLTYYGVAGLPFGGVGESGYGRSKGLEGLEELTRSRSLVVDRLGLKRELWWFPYSRASERLLRMALLFRWKGGIRGALAAVVFMVRRKRG